MQLRGNKEAKGGHTEACRGMKRSREAMETTRQWRGRHRSYGDIGSTWREIIEIQ
jgi:hypothetical protein